MKLNDGDEVNDFNSLDNFDSYNSTTIKQIWKDYWNNGTCAEVFTEQTIVRSGQSMWYKYSNKTYPPYYSEAEADISALDTNDPNWFRIWDGTLSLWFYGQAGNDVNEPMYVKLVDSEEQTATVFYRDYGDMNDIKEEKWHVWNIHIADFIVANWFIDLTNVAKIVIGFGDGSPPAASDGVVYFEDIRLYNEYPPPEHSATVIYDGYPEYIKEPRWHVWNIPLAEFNDVNLGNVAKIAIGFGDGNSPGGEPNGKGTVYFEDIILRNGPAEDIYYDGSVYLDEDPFVNGYLGYPLLLKQDCRLIDAGGDYVDEVPCLVGKTTAWEGTPDNNVADIGFHYFNWYYVNADLNLDGIVNFKDFAILANSWQQSTSGPEDLDDSGFVDYNDVSILAGQWLHLAGPNIQIQLVGDGNNGFVEVGASGYTSDTQRIFLLVDGQYVGEIFGFRERWPFEFDASELGPGTHQLKAVSVDSEGNVTCSNLQENTFNCFLNYCFCKDAYEANEPHKFYGYYSGTNDIYVKVYNEDSNLVWSQTYAAGNLCGSIPAEITSADDLDSIIFEEVPSGGIMAIAKPLARKFNPDKVPANVRALLVLPDWWVNLNNDVDDAVMEAFETRGVLYYKLKRSNATYKNFRWFAMHRNIEYIYYAGHGGYGYDPCTQEYYFGGENILRTEILLADGRVVSAKYTDFPPGTAPPWCVPLQGSYERTRRSFYSMKGFLPQQLKFVDLDCCHAGRLRINSLQQLVESEEGIQGLAEIPESDMSWAFNMTGGETCGQYCQGWWWYADKMFYDGKSIYERFSIKEWNALKEGKNLHEATDIVFNDPNVHIDARRNFRVHGMGYIVLVKIE